jgi:hypothetical protein
MKKMSLFVFLAMLCLGLCLALSCRPGHESDSSGGDDDDASVKLTWQNPPASDYLTWEEAKIYCGNLSLDEQYDWRLPTISELRSLIRGCDATVLPGGACNVTDECLDSTCGNAPCAGCDYLAGPGSGGAYWPAEMSGEILWYWSSSEVTNFDEPTSGAWGVDFDFGDVQGTTNDDTSYGLARCVR